MIDLVAYACFFLTVALGYAIMCLGLNVQWGQTGVFNVGVAGFVAVGAYASVLLTTPPTVDRLGGFELPIGVGWLAAFLVSGALSALIGWLTIRLRSDYLAIATFGFAVTVQLAALNLESITGGPFGVGFVPRPFGAWAREPLRFAAANLAVVAALVIALYLVLQRLTRSPWGRVLRAIREDETAAESLGKNPTAFRVQAFALGGAIMGLGGAVQAHFIGFIAPENYLPMLTFQVWAMLVVGGSGNHRGAILGAVLVWGVWALSATLIDAVAPGGQQARAASLQIVVIGTLLCLILLHRPRGLIGERDAVSRHVGADDSTRSPPGA